MNEKIRIYQKLSQLIGLGPKRTKIVFSDPSFSFPKFD
jgi:hypothetical protein